MPAKKKRKKMEIDLFIKIMPSIGALMLSFVNHAPRLATTSVILAVVLAAMQLP